MKKKINIEKRVDFPTMIGEVCAISLEHNLKFIDEVSVGGNLILSGKYKMTEASRLEEDFYYEFPLEIALTERLELNTSKIEISDFYYEIENDDIMICHIDLDIEGVEVVDFCDDLFEERECDGDINKEIEDYIKEEVKIETEKEIDIMNITDDNETYGTFVVYMVRQNETVNSILEKYNTTIEEMEKYNDLKNIMIGTKLIIPLLRDNEK